MCGIVGLVSPLGGRDDPSGATIGSTIDKMTDALEHRGPDDRGVWLRTFPTGSPRRGEAENITVALGHRRLSIIDLAETGHQPMVSPSTSLVMVYNGEIYNHDTLKKDLISQGYVHWRGTSDTEVLLRCFEAWGIETTLSRICGMFAIALLDCNTRELTLMRDRMGEKPLYYGWVGGDFFFGSELKVLKPLLSAKKGRGDRASLQIDTLALENFFRYGYVPAPQSIFKDVHKLPPGTYGTLSCDSFRGGKSLIIQPYWSAKAPCAQPAQAAISDVAAPRQGDMDQQVDRLETILQDVIDEISVSDVPIGAFLSGGIDSSLVTAMMQRKVGRRINTFSVGFHEAGFNEAHHAKAVANFLGTTHHEIYMKGTDAPELAEALPRVYDEPLSDSSQLPTILVSQLARRYVTVAVSGDGADELFGGYYRYRQAFHIHRYHTRLPSWVRQVMAAGIQTLLPPVLLKSAVVRGAGLDHPIRRLRNGAEVLRGGADGIYDRMIAQWPSTGPSPLTQGEGHQSPPPLQSLHELGDNDYVANLLYTDMMTYLPDDIMVKVDRAAMACSLETRAPFLDKRVVEFACGLPLSMKTGHVSSRSGESGASAAWVGKKILKNLVYRYVPRAILDRPKQGFGVPLAVWLRGPLRDWAEALLTPSSLTSSGLLNSLVIGDLWRDFLEHSDAHLNKLWAVLMFQSWYKDWEAYIESPKASPGEHPSLRT